MAKLLKGIPQEFKNIDQPSMQNDDDALNAIKARTTVVSQQKADSYAYYEVVQRKPLQIRWIPYCDKWTADPAWIRGLRIGDVEAQENWSKRLADLYPPV